MSLINPFEYDPTPQQVDCVHKVKTYPVVKVDAIAGSGKTTLLELIAHNLQEKSLYMTFSRVLADEAKERFPPWVECRTIHSLAFGAEGRFFAHKLRRPDGKYKNVASTGKEIAQWFKLKPVMVEEDVILTTAWLGLLIKKTLAKYEASRDEFIEKHHLPLKDIEDKIKMVKPRLKDKSNLKIFEDIKGRLIEYAGKLWEERIDPESDVLITHDTYVKMFALTSPHFDYDVIYIDEAQDVSGVMLSIIERQTHAKLVYVGDRDQNIYSWRHSVNAMAEVDCVHAELTKSFRYGKDLAEVASKILDGRPVEGFEKVTTKVAPEGIIGDRKYTKIFRTNGLLLSSALKLIKDGVKINIETDLAEFIVLLKSAKALFEGKLNQVKHEEVAPYLSWTEFSEEAENDKSLDRIAQIVEGKKADYYISVLKRHNNVKNPDVIYVTAHKAKGREWPNVILAEDFPDGYEEGEYKGLSDEEKRLLYVASTRAIERLEYNSSVANILSGMEVNKTHIQDVAGVEIGDIGIHHVRAGMNPTLPDVKGEMAQEALNRAGTEEDLLDQYVCGDMSLQDAYECGIVDESGAVTDQIAYERAVDRMDLFD